MSAPGPYRVQRLDGYLAVREVPYPAGDTTITDLVYESVWEVYSQHEGPAGTESIATFRTRREARECARRLNTEDEEGT